VVNRDVGIGYALLVVAIWLWAGNAVVARTAMLADVPPIAFNFWRWTLALLIFLPFTARGVWRHRQLVRERWLYFAVYGLMSVTLFNNLFYLGLQSTTAVQGSLIMAILPVLVLILVATVLGHRITGRQIAGAVITITGAAVIVLRGDAEVIRTLAINVGDAWCLAAVVVWAIQILMLRWKPVEIEITPFMTVIIAFGVAFQIPLYVWEHAAGDVFRPDGTSLMLVLYVALFAAVLGTTMYNAGVIRVGPANAGYFANLYPACAAVLAIIFLGEPFEWYHGAGGALVLAGIYLATFAHRSAAGPKAGVAS
jgi:drug/metabolite transporter (DMT)-like permease